MGIPQPPVEGLAVSLAASSRSRRRGGRRSAIALGLSLMAGLLPAAGAAAPVLAVSSDIVISQLYGGGGNSGATLTNDFIELFNRGTAPVSISGWSVQYGSATGTSWQVTALSGTVQPGQYYLVQEAAGAGGTTPLPTPDASGSIALSATGGKVALVSSTGALSGSCPTGTVDLVGYGTANCFEGGGATASLSNTTAAIRGTGGCTETDANSADFAVGAPDPRNSASPVNTCGPAAPILVINEIDYDQPSTDAAEFVELKNAGTSAIDLDGYSLELVNGTGGGATIYDTIDLPAITLPAGDYFVICANAATVANCDLDDGPDTNFIQNGAPDAVGLRLGATLVDSVSYEGDSGAPYTEGSGAGLADDAANAAESISRCPDGSDTDQNNVDFELRPSTPGAVNICRDPGTLVINEIDYDQPGTDAAEFIELKNVSASAIELDPYTLELVNGSGGGAVVYDTIDLPAVTLAAGDYFVICANAATVANCDLDEGPDTNFIQNGAPDGVGLRLGGAPIDAVSYEGNTGTPYTEGSGTGLEDDGANAAASIGRCADGSDTDQNNVDFELHPASPGSANACDVPPDCGTTVTSIHAIQGTGTSTPLTGSTVVIEGIVVGDYQQTGGFGGFFVQEQDAESDADPATSEGIFVFFPTGPDVAVGDAVTVCGIATEFGNLTELTSVAFATIDSSGNPLPSASSVGLPVASIGDLEAYEGMLVAFAQELTVTEVFTLARFGEVALSGTGRLANPTNVVEPGAPAIALQALNDRSRILLDDGDNRQNIDPTVYPQGGLSATNTLRVGDTLDALTGVLDYRFGVYRVQPVTSVTGPIAFDHDNPRPAAPAAVGGNLKVASFNVLNYFNGDGLGGGFPTARGASSAAELARQTDKIVAALVGLDADIVGLMELENDSGANQAISDLVDALNAATAPGTYGFIDTGVIGSDEIRVGLLYKPSAVSPVGAHAALTSAIDARFIDSLNRPSLAQTFGLASGGRLTVVVNHLKSKGSNCISVGDPDLGDGQGNCNLTRTNAAMALVDWIATDPTGSGDRDVLVIGDLNAYAKEDPIDAFVDAGFVDVHQAFEGPDAYSFVFQGQSGYLDHALASPTLVAQITGAAAWHINPDEPIALDYNVEFKSAGQVTSFYDPGPYRASDHDPIVVGIQLANRDASGLLPPIGQATVKAGQTLPVQFSLGGFAGDDVLFEAPQVFVCSAYPLGSSTDIVTAGKSMLDYDAISDVYTIAWKTAKSWANSCRTVEVTFDDGSFLFASVTFTK